MMMARAGDFTRADLERAFAQYAEAHGDDLAKEALKRSTGATEVTDVPDHRIISGLAELVGGYSFVGRRRASKEQAAADGLANVHTGLAAIREKAFAKLSGKAGN